MITVSENKGRACVCQRLDLKRPSQIGSDFAVVVVVVNYRKLFRDLIPSLGLWEDMRFRDDMIKGSCISGGVSRPLNLRIESLLEKENKLPAYGLYNHN